jgi:pilus assembly protein CpaE
MPQPETSKLYGNWNALFIGPNPQTSRDLTPFLSRFLPTFSKKEIEGYPARHQISELFSSQTVNLCFVDVASDQERALSLIPDVLRVEPKLPIIALLAGNDPQLILRCLRQGATEFLLQPFTEEQVGEALRKIAKTNVANNRGGKAPGKVYAVMPAKGGCGATTVACNLAYQWKRLGAKQVLLADLDPLSGTLSFVLKLKSAYSFMDALQRSGEIDADLWRSMVNARQGVDVLLAPEVMIEGANELADCGPIVEYARSVYDVMFLDTNGVYGEWNLSQAHRSDEILLVATNELTSLQAVQRSLSYLDANGVGRWKVRLLVNRYDRHMGLSREVISTALHMDIDYLLPSDYESIQKSLMEGKPIPPASSFGKALIGLSDKLAGREESAKKGSSLSSLRSLFSRTSS